MSGGQLKVPLTIRTQGGAGWSPGAQHAQQLEAWLVHVPGLKVVFASTPTDVRGLLWSAIYDDNPVVFFEHRLALRDQGRGAGVSGFFRKLLQHGFLVCGIARKGHAFDNSPRDVSHELGI